MKKIFSFLLICLCLIPATFLVGCGNDDYNAKNVKNKTYYVSLLEKNSTDITESLKENNTRIFFGDDYFKFEYSEEGESLYGYYVGTYKVDDDIVKLTISEFGGVLEGAKNSASYKHFVLSELRYKKGVLYEEFLLDGDIYSYEFKIPKK